MIHTNILITNEINSRSNYDSFLMNFLHVIVYSSYAFEYNAANKAIIYIYYSLKNLH